MMNAAVGLALGAMLGVFGAFLFDYIGIGGPAINSREKESSK